MSVPLVSCIIAVRNGEKYLRDAIDSVLAQRGAAVELVVVDDGSDDATTAIARSYGERMVLHVQPNAGVSVARNRGAAIARGELLSFLDADDRLHPDKLALQLARFAARPELSLCDGHTEYFCSPELDAATLRREHSHREFLGGPVAGHISTWLLRRALFDASGGFAPGMAYAEDVDLRSRWRDAGALCETLSDVLSYRRLHWDNATGRNPRQQGDALAVAMKAHLDRVRRTRIPD